MVGCFHSITGFLINRKSIPSYFDNYIWFLILALGEFLLIHVMRRKFNKQNRSRSWNSRRSKGRQADEGWFYFSYISDKPFKLYVLECSTVNTGTNLLTLWPICWCIDKVLRQRALRQSACWARGGVCPAWCTDRGREQAGHKAGFPALCNSILLFSQVSLTLYASAHTPIWSQWLPSLLPPWSRLPLPLATWPLSSLPRLARPLLCLTPPSSALLPTSRCGSPLTTRYVYFWMRACPPTAYQIEQYCIFTL